jgi:hypothetical protein
MEVLGASGAPQCAAATEEADAIPWLDDSARSLLWDLVVHHADASIPRSAAAGDAAPVPESLSTMSLRVSGLYFLGSLGAPPRLSTRGEWRMR